MEDSAADEPEEGSEGRPRLTGWMIVTIVAIVAVAAVAATALITHHSTNGVIAGTSTTKVSAASSTTQVPLTTTAPPTTTQSALRPRACRLCQTSWFAREHRVTSPRASPGVALRAARTSVESLGLPGRRNPHRVSAPSTRTMAYRTARKAPGLLRRTTPSRCLSRRRSPTAPESERRQGFCSPSRVSSAQRRSPPSGRPADP